MWGNNQWSETKRFLSKHYVPVLIAIVVLVVVVVLLSTLLSKSSSFVGSNVFNYGASPYVKFVQDSSSEDKYKWVEEDKVDLNQLTPEYNFQSGVAEYRFGDQVYDSDAAVVEDHPVANVKEPQQVMALLPSSQVNAPPVIETDWAKMVPAAPSSGETVVLNLPASVASSPPVIVPAQSGIPMTVVAPVMSDVPAVSTFRSAYY
jgi:hypothetical protein